jgi:predicted NAD/FAD-binding protein
MDRMAIIGTGISGLGCAYFLKNRYQLTLYEKADYIGGHTNTLSIEEEGGSVPIDTGFMTYNEVTYPNLTRLFSELGVASRSSSMSFSVQHLPAELEFCGSSLNHLFGQRRNLFKPEFWKMLLQINRFNKEASAAVHTPDQHLTLSEYVAERKYGQQFLDYYLLPMSCAVWSTPPDRMLQFPAMTLLRFFHNHGFLGLHTQHPWLTVTGGAKHYVDKIVRPLRDRIYVNRGAVAVRRESGGGVRVTDESGHTAHYDHVILACHADQALNMLEGADDYERAALSEFKYQPNTALVHTDDSVMPRTSLCWSSWNYRVNYDVDARLEPATIYWINRLQGINSRRNYFVSINGEDTIKPQSVVRRIHYEHPLFNDGAIRAQRELPLLNERHTGIYFAGSYFRYGFHEDAFSSALNLSRLLAPGTWS